MGVDPADAAAREASSLEECQNLAVLGDFRSGQGLKVLKDLAAALERIRAAGCPAHPLPDQERAVREWLGEPA
jgi:hypothetical protein